MRLQEVYETYNSFKRLVSDPSEQGRTKFDEKATPDSISRFMSSLPNSIDFDNVHLTGHSFGGGTMVSFPPSYSSLYQLHLLQTPPPGNMSRIPVKRCIALDPWVEPLPRPAPSTSGPLPRVPILCINSPGFTEWSTHFNRLLEMVKKVDGSFLSLLGASRMSPLYLT
jgi:platelet-activating factor acetylhydrolase